LFTIPEVFEEGIVDDQLAIEPDGGAGADLDDAEAIPLAQRLVGEDEWVLAGSAGTVVPQSARAFVGADVPLAALLGVVPDLHLRSGFQVNAAVGLGHRLVVDEEFDVAELLV